MVRLRLPPARLVREHHSARDDTIGIPAETATSEDFRLDALHVVAPDGAAVSGTGHAWTPPSPDRAPAPRPTSSAPTPSATSRSPSGPTRSSSATSSGRACTCSPRCQGREPTRSIGPTRSTARSDDSRRSWARSPTPTCGWRSHPRWSSGLEYPGALQFGDLPADALPELVAHELAHQWFYQLVGNNQARDPWLDEGFATYAQAVADDTPDAYSADDVPKGLRGRLGDPMAIWSDRGANAYYTGVYVQGAATLLDARDRFGAEAFDAAVPGLHRRERPPRRHPSDLARALSGLPSQLSACSPAPRRPPPARLSALRSPGQQHRSLWLAPYVARQSPGRPGSGSAGSVAPAPTQDASQ